MYFEYFFSSCNVRDPYYDLSVETARSQKCRVKYIRSVGCSQDNDPRIFCKTILKLMALQAVLFAGCYSITENLGHLLVNWLGLPTFSWLNWGLLWTLGAAMGGFMALRTRRAYFVFAACIVCVAAYLLI